jgi:hypothetical protein
VAGLTTRLRVVRLRTVAKALVAFKQTANAGTTVRSG